MKKLMVLLVSLMTIATAATARVDNDRPISVTELSPNAQQFIKQHFPNEKVSFAKMERDFLEVRYEVVFVNGSKVEFYKDGTWKEVDCKFSAVPAAVVPKQIVSHVKANYPEAVITQIDRDSRDYEVKLNNGLELTFNMKFQLVDIDD